jgi:IS30 family transposase
MIADHLARRFRGVVAAFEVVEVAVVKSGRPGLARAERVVFWEGVRGGLEVADAARAAGIGLSSGHRLFGEAGGVKANGPSAGGGRYLSFAEREEIAVGLAAGETRRSIAVRLGRHPSMIGREVRRNGPRAGGYRARAAEAQAQHRARRPRPAKLAGDGRLRGHVQARLLEKWSPAQISAMLAQEFPGEPEMRVCHETIYQAIYVQGRGALRRELAACLRTGRAVRRPRRREGERRGPIPGMVMISQRPAEAADRAVPGHWEGDLILGKDGASAIGTLVERSTRFVMLLHLPGRHDAASVAAQMSAQMMTLPAALRRSLTWDQGSELSGHADFTMATGIAVYFCDPHSPWQRGSNENTNGLLRQYFPKGTSLRAHTKDDLDAAAAQLNARPRQTLGWKTPAQKLTGLLGTPPAGLA